MDGTHGQDKDKAKAQRRRLESEMLIYQSDRSKLLRIKEGIDGELRALKKELSEAELRFTLKEQEVQKVVRDIQELETEMTRLKRQFNLLV